jgi:hypothetical protein
MATVIPVENSLEIAQTERDCRIKCKISLYSIIYIVLLSIIALGSAYFYMENNIIPNNQNPSSDTKYYQYYSIIYSYSAYYSNYTLNTNNINNYYIKYYFTIIDDTNREKNNILCDQDSTSDINVANIYLPNKYKPYQKVVLYYINDDTKCTLNLPSKNSTIYILLSGIFLVFAILLVIFIPIFKC